MSHPPLLDEVSTECCCPERASFEPSAHSQREPPSFATVASSQRRDRRSPVFGSHAGADGEAAERVACRASRAHLLLEGRGVGPSMTGEVLGLMLTLDLARRAAEPLRVLCVGAHSDDIEIGCGGTILKLGSAHPQASFHWVVFSADAERESEARRSAGLFLPKTGDHQIVVERFRDGFFPYVGTEIKEYFEALKQQASPDVIFTHYRGDRHQDHRLISELTWNTFRDHLILEYEVPKYDGDLGSPNCYVPLDEALCRRKTEYLFAAFKSQVGKRWFTADTFRGLMRIRGIEAGVPGCYAEAFYAHKLVVAA